MFIPYRRCGITRDCKGRYSLCQGCGNAVPAVRLFILKGRRPLTSPFKRPRPLKIPCRNNSGLQRDCVPLPRVRERRSRVKGTYIQGALPLDNPVQGTTSLENPASGAAKHRAHVRTLCTIQDCKGTVFLCQGCGNGVPALRLFILKGHRPLITPFKGPCPLKIPRRRDYAPPLLFHNKPATASAMILDMV